MPFLDAARLAPGTGWAGLPGDALALVLARQLPPPLGDGPPGPARWVIVCDGPDRAARLADGLRTFLRAPDRVWVWPADDVRPYDGFSPDPAIPARRLRLLDEAAGPAVIVAPAAALLQRVPDRAARAEAVRELAAGVRMDRDALVAWLQAGGYLGVGKVESEGTFAVRGDVLDVWPVAGDLPVRVDFFDDEIEEVRGFDPDTQRTRGKLPRARILQAREERLDAEAVARAAVEIGRHVASQQRGLPLRRRVLEDLQAGVRFSGLEAWAPALHAQEDPLDALGAATLLVVHPDEVARAVREADRSARERWLALEPDERPLVPPPERYVDGEAFLARIAGAAFVDEVPREGRSVDLGAQGTEGFAVRGAELGPIAARLGGLARDGARVVLVADRHDRAEQLASMLGPYGLRPMFAGSPWAVKPGDVAITVGPLRQGFVAVESGWVVLPTAALFGERARTAPTRKHAAFQSGLGTLSDVKEGDLVVHRTHGVGQYRGLVRVRVQGTEPPEKRTYSAAEGVKTSATAAYAKIEQDFVRVEYRDGDVLMLPATRLEELSRFRPAHEGANVKLDKLGGSTWIARRGKVRDSLLAMADELLRLYAKRELAERPPYKKPGPLYRAFVSRFPYDETPDQAHAIEEVNADLDGDEPMDRLVCGDVGFGKTEVAMRAAMRVVEGGRQAAVLCPTTVLAFQHHQSFAMRFLGLPVRVAMLSRFTPPEDEAPILADLRAGRIDVLVGTQRILGRGVRFKDLGLLVIDEEHRFGVKQKEQLKKMRANVDVLAMSATPIPRTLQMGLGGLRDMSLITTPPRDRLAVRTTLDRLAPARVQEAIRGELARDGQVFFVHNRVEDIDAMADKLRAWVPEARFAVAHGQMEAEALEDVLIAFIDKKYDVLVTSAIIESGVDLPNVNTMIVNHAERFGLAQLYQLRGRVGRGAQRGHCVLLVPDELGADAKKRVRALIENADLGAGFRVAMADLELRGAGNLLGDSQSGNIDQIGYEAWLELLEEAVHVARGELDRDRIDPEVEIPVPAFLPDGLIRDPNERLGWYRRLSSAVSEGEAEGILDELRGWVGELPPEVENLGGLAAVKASCRRYGVVRCSWLKVRLVLELHPRSPALGKVRALVEKSPKRFGWTDKDGVGRLEVRFLPEEAQKPVHFVRWVFAQLGRE